MALCDSKKFARGVRAEGGSQDGAGGGAGAGEGGRDGARERIFGATHDTTLHSCVERRDAQ